MGRRKYSKIQKTKLPSDEFKNYLLQFNSNLLAYGLMARNVEADGNCLFRAIADQLEGNEANHLYYRSLATNILFQQRDYYSSFTHENFSSYLEQMQKSGIWGGHLELQALSDVLNIPIFVHTNNNIQPINPQNKTQKNCIDFKSRKFIGWRLILVKIKIFIDKIRFIHQRTNHQKLSINIAFHEGKNIIEHYTSIRKITDCSKLAAQDISENQIQKIIYQNLL